MLKAAAVFVSLLCASAFAAPPNFPPPAPGTRPSVRVACMVYLTTDNAKVIASPTGTISNGQEFVAFHMGKLDYTVAVTENTLAMFDVLHQLVLTIRRNGKVIAQTMADYEPGKSTNVSIATESNLPSMNCSNTY
jgi:hypothetical protein